MTFEEFFKKKKISLIALSATEAGLFVEFKTHYEAMGEKSFDHTKKYWFNKLRRLYPLPPEIKAEKVIIENQLAEQTITETLTGAATESTPAKAGFTPRFKANTLKPKSIEPETKTEEIQPESSKEPTALTPPVKPGFKPRFKAGVTTPQPAEPAAEPDAKNESEEPVNLPAPAKVGFKPRFKPPQQ